MQRNKWSKKAWKSLALAPGVVGGEGMDGETLFSNFIVVFQLQKEMRKGVCVRTGVPSPWRAHRAACARSTCMSKNVGST